MVKARQIIMKRQNLFSLRNLLVVLTGLLCGTDFAVAELPRRTISLDGAWQFQVEGASTNEWKRVTVPSSFQSHEGTNFHGVGWYRKLLQAPHLQPGQRLLLHFAAAATEAKVNWDGQEVGRHLGGWTPFRCDVTRWALKSSAPPHEVKVRLDEKVGHNTQGFLPVIEPHFGGLWQEVEWLVVPETYIDDLRVMAIGNPATGRLEIEFPIMGTETPDPAQCSVRWRLKGAKTWNSETMAVSPVTSGNGAAVVTDRRFHVEVRVPDYKVWEPSSPNLYEIELTLPTSMGGDQISTRAAFRSIEAHGSELRLNGHRLSVRGVLNWGYSPPIIAPNPGERKFRSDLEWARSEGFNLMKFCLWIPPHRYLELADELGFLVWQEYPTWHPTMTGKFLTELRQEFDEFFVSDRNHPAVILRSLTCESGKLAEPEVLKALYDQAHRMLPRSLIEDDSSWITWNRFTDFWDDHPYGNNHTWVTNLHSLRDYANTNGLKPLVLGEAITADTWVDAARFRRQLGKERPYWVPAVIDTQAKWLDQMRAQSGPGGLNELEPESLHYGMLMRKFQIEAYRREVPSGGYVISVIRDFPKASMGLLDYSDKPKYSTSDWAWQGDTILLLQTDEDRRSFSTGERLRANILISHFGQLPIADGRLVLTVTLPDQGGKLLQRIENDNVTQSPGSLAPAAGTSVILPEVDQPTRLLITASLKTRQGRRSNSWPIWLVPRTTIRPEQIRIDVSVDKTTAELFPGAKAWTKLETEAVVIASRFSPEIATFLNRGGKVLMLPDGTSNSIPMKEHWFLRGAPYLPDSPLLKRMPRNFLVELQAFDLASNVMTDIPFLDSIDPMLMLWDTHDDTVVKTHALVFEAQAGQGRLLVSGLNHQGAVNAAGKWILGQLVEILAKGPEPTHSWPAKYWQAGQVDK